MVDYQFYLDYFIELVLPRTTEILYKPIILKNLLWIIAPLLITLVLIQLYFGRYKNEELGWNTAFGNSVSLLWVTTTLFRFVYEQNNGSLLAAFLLNKNKIILISILGLWAMLSIFLQFFHILPRKIDFLIYSSVSILLFFSVFFFLIRHHIKAPRAVEISLSLRKKHNDELRKKKIQKIRRKLRYNQLKYKMKLK